MLGAARPGEVDFVILQHWILRFGAASMGLRQIVREFGDWMANGRPPWAAYRALIMGRLISLNNFPGLSPVIVGETWHQMLAKCVLAVTGAEAKEACGTEQLYRGLEAVIKGGIYLVRLL